MASHFVILLLTLSILSVSSANGKNFPSLFNAKEVSYVSHAVVDGTNSKDVEGLTALLDKFSILQALSVNDDPCLGALPWFWIKCNTDPTPRVTELTLAGLQLVGSLPDFSSMDALEIIDLSNNKLNGPIPDFLGNLPKLQELNLARNNFRGTIPASLFNNPRISLKTTGNPDLCQSDKPCKETTSTNDPSDTTTSQIPVINYPPSDTTTSQIPVINYPPYSTTSETPYVYYPSTSKKKKNKLPAILGAVFSTRFLLWAIVGVFAIFRHKRKSAAAAVVNAGQKVDQGVASEQVPVDLEMDHQIQGNENQNGHAWDI